MLSNRKITDSNINSKGVVAAPDRLTGTAAQNKAIFDRLVREIVKEAINSVIDDLVASTGASEIGFTPISGIASNNVQAAISSLTSGTASSLALKADKSSTDLHFKDISLNESTGVITLTRENGTTKSIDTALEKVVINWSYDAQTQSLVLTMKDGTTVSVSLSSFITETEFEGSSTIDFSVVNHTVSAALKPGSITDQMLSSTLVNLLSGYVDAASESASDAAVSASSAGTSSASASASAVSAEASKTEAVNAATNASQSESNANAEGLKAEGYAVGEQNGVPVGNDSPYYHNNSKYFKEQAEGAVTGDMNKSVYDTHHKEVDIFDYVDEGLSLKQDALTNTDEQIQQAVSDKHTHSNKSLLDAIGDVIPAEYNSATVYNKGSLCMKDGLLKQCNSNNVTGSWNSSYWATVRIGNAAALNYTVESEW